MSQKTILLIEDNQDDIDLTLRAFKKNHLLNEIIVIKDGAEVLEYLDNFHNPEMKDRTKPPTLILLDLKLPKIDGLEILKSIRSNTETKLIPVVILTSSLEEQDLIEGYLYGANSYIRKPVDFTKFLEAVHQLGMYWLLLNETPQ